MKSRLKKVSAAWFRGFSEPTSIEFSDKSVVIYGENGAGKSSFVDVIEFIVRGGWLAHLRHEYSGRRQEKGTINTHTPKNKNGSLQIDLADGSVITGEIVSNGNCTITPDPNVLSILESQRVILRQDEVADFIKGTKGEKYSSLLPLLGLGNLDTSIENLKKLEKGVIEQSGIEFKKGQIRGAQEQAKEKFGGGEIGKTALSDELIRLTSKYCLEQTFLKPEEAVIGVLTSLTKKLEVQTKEQFTYSDLVSISKLSFSIRASNIRTKSLKLSKSAEPFLREKLEVLDKASHFAEKIESSAEIECPACGSHVSSEGFKNHVSKEYQRLSSTLGDFKDYKNEIDLLCTDLQSFKTLLKKDTVKTWKDQQESRAISYIESIELSKIRDSLVDQDLSEIEKHTKVLTISAAETSKVAPPEIRELLDDKAVAEIILAFLDARKLNEFIVKIEQLLAFLRELQTTLRARIKAQSSAAISAISDDIAHMWETLHPEESIEGVQLSLPTDQDKAIEIGLKFYGVEQMSPRLTLSEGHRNSLGLCIFLAMAKNVGNENIPIVLDDVVVSFDRNHRGRIATLLQQELANRQILLFTHDREWFIELKQLLDAGAWEFKALMPWRDPITGIRWSAKDTNFDDAKHYIDSDPSAAGNEARKIMDTHLPLLSERMQLKMPYLFREKNDHRTAHDFLERILSDGKKCLEIKSGVDYIIFQDGLDKLSAADKEIISRGNRSSHSHSLTPVEAKDLIEKCEVALEVFVCQNCKKYLTKTNDAGSELVQCQCGQLRWRYGKS